MQTFHVWYRKYRYFMQINITKPQEKAYWRKKAPEFLLKQYGTIY